MDEPRPDLEVTVLGSGTCVPSRERSSCALLVRSAGRSVLLDAGPGTLRRLAEAGAAIDDLTAVLFSHLHPDHTADLVPLLFATKYDPEGRRTDPLLLVGGRGFADFYARLKGAYGEWIDPGRGRLDIREVAVKGPDALRIPGIEVRTAPTVHTPQSVAFRLQGPAGTSIVYSGDTDWAETLVQLAEGADLLVCEAAFPEGRKVEGHLTPALAGRIAARAGVRRLMLTHFYPACDAVDIAAQCRRSWSGPLLLARDLMRISLP